MAARRRAWNSEGSIVDWAIDDWTAHDNNKRGVRKRHMVRIVARLIAHLFPARKAFLTGWTRRLTNRNVAWGEPSERIRD